MRCSKIKALLVTDYHDGELDAARAAEITRHLERCPRCRDFYAAVRTSAARPFHLEREREVPRHLWSAIKARIEAESERAGLSRLQALRTGLEDLCDRLLTLPRPVRGVSAAVLAGLFVFVLFTFVPTERHSATAEYLTENVLFFAAAPQEIEEDGFDSVIEEFFL